MRLKLLLFFSGILMMSEVAFAQVFKCKDANGRVMYSDTGCSSMQQGHKIEREKTMQQKYQERAQAFQAQQDKQARLLREQEREIQEREDRVMRATAAPAEPAAPRHKGYAERLQERNDGVRSVFAKPKPSLAKSTSPQPSGTTMTAPPPVPSVLTHCAGGFCYDNMGGAYHQHGRGTTMTGPSGSTCIRTGATVQCP